jgi:hypothetical protein
VDTILREVETSQAITDCNDGTDQATGRKRVLVYIHGGLNTYGTALERVDAMLQIDEKDVRSIRRCFYPIFINWRSAFVSSYKDHLFAVRQGRFQKARAFATFPFALLDDVANLPFGFLGTGGDLVLDGEATGNATTPSDASCAKGELAAALAHSSDKTIAQRTVIEAAQRADLQKQVKYGRCSVERGDRLFDIARRFPLGVLKPVTGAPVDSFGDPAARIMTRRTELMFAPEQCSSFATLPERDVCRKWSLNYLFERLSERAGMEADNWEITLVGHSMGAIVVTEALRRFPRMPVRNIVFMGAAVTLESYEDVFVRDTMHGYLARHPRAELFHLSLHRLAEIREVTLQDAAPRGSLLVWLDAFINEPQHIDQYTAGRTVTILRSLLDIKEPRILARVHLREFDYEPRKPKNERCTPQKHGEFDDFVFWRRDFWTGGGPGIPSDSCRVTAGP